MDIKAVIFDLDGTLLDTLDDIADAMNYSLSKNGFSVYTTERYKTFVGSGVDVLVERVLADQEYANSDFQNVKNDYIRKYESIQKNKTKPYDGILEIIEWLQDRNVKLAVLSNKPHNDTLAVIDYYFDAGTFDVVFGQREGVERKPSPDAVFEILDILDVKKDAVMYIGDTDIDMLTATSAGVISVGALWGFRSVDELTNAGAKVLIKTPIDLISFVNLEQ